ncbi:S41 family peptidase [Sphingomonas rhizophila]|uniref:S41 family peptidase n=1 Tax=Sphingomonas rhizophila TaxID=2071607 RepID=A0A7G9SB48_9SPHN|nr:S41 family peptidase [Sphingomonas rhizophila]QNN65073.1 S41 family peptidase [Sphingomonas rhizophila]
MLKTTLMIAVAALSAVPLAAAPKSAPKAAAEVPPEPMPFIKADAEKAVSDLAQALDEGFVFPDAGTKYAAMLRANLAAGRYASFPSADAFAKQVTADLQAVHKDGHLRIHPFKAGSEKGGRGPAGGDARKSAVLRSGWLGDGVAYIDFGGFPGNEETLSDVRKFIAAHGNARTLIIDARHNGGGGLGEMNLLFAQLYAQPTTLVTMDMRRAVEEKHGTPFGDNDPLLRKVDGPATIVRREHIVIPAATATGLRTAKVYLLTSKRTFSAAEHLSMSLKRTKRATLVGEATGGGAHFGGMAPMGTGYAAFIPVGRTFDPDTGQSWEAVGVAPDVAVPADKALEEALRLAGVPATGDKALAGLH